MIVVAMNKPYQSFSFQSIYHLTLIVPISRFLIHFLFVPYEAKFIVDFRTATKNKSQTYFHSFFYFIENSFLNVYTLCMYSFNAC